MSNNIFKDGYDEDALEIKSDTGVLGLFDSGGDRDLGTDFLLLAGDPTSGALVAVELSLEDADALLDFLLPAVEARRGEGKGA